jgi:hypothetical protein
MNDLPEPAKRIESTENLDQTLKDLLQHHVEELKD